MDLAVLLYFYAADVIRNMAKRKSTGAVMKVKKYFSVEEEIAGQTFNTGNQPRSSLPRRIGTEEDDLRA